MQLDNIYRPLHEQNLAYRVFARWVSFLYSIMMNLRNFFYDKGYLRSVRLPGICISVGNISLGGSGKSPMVCEIAKMLISQSHSPVILTRGYKSSLKAKDMMVLIAGKIVLQNFSGPVRQMPDEAMMQSQKMPSVPVIVGRKRAKAAIWFLEQNLQKVSHWILDDGFQHRKIQRDTDILLLDAKDPFGNGQIFPLGSLREPLSSIARANLVCFTRANQQYPLAKTEQIVSSHYDGPKLKVSLDFKIKALDESVSFGPSHQPLLVMCGIAHPERFIAQIKGKGIAIGKTYLTKDHSPFDHKQVIENLVACSAILTTEKDYWRNPTLFNQCGRPVFIAQLSLQFSISHENILLEKCCRSR